VSEYDEHLKKHFDRWRAPAPSFSGRVFRKIGCDDLVAAIWRQVQETAFPGIAYDDWHDGPDHNHPGSVSDLEWIGEVPYCLEPSPFPGATRFPVLLTGPYPYMTRFPHEAWDGKEGEAELLAWLVPPDFQSMEGHSCSFTGERPRDYWDLSWATGTPMIPFRGLSEGGLDHLREAFRAVVRASLPGWNMGSGRPGRSWSATVDAYVGVPPDEGR